MVRVLKMWWCRYFHEKYHESDGNVIRCQRCGLVHDWYSLTY